MLRGTTAHVFAWHSSRRSHTVMGWNFAGRKGSKWKGMKEWWVFKRLQYWLACFFSWVVPHPFGTDWHRQKRHSRSCDWQRALGMVGRAGQGYLSCHTVHFRFGVFFELHNYLCMYLVPEWRLFGAKTILWAGKLFHGGNYHRLLIDGHQCDPGNLPTLLRIVVESH